MHPLANIPEVIEQVTPQVVQLLQAIEGEMGRAELMAHLGLRDRMHFSHHYLIPALEADVIEMTKVCQTIVSARTGCESMVLA